MSRVMKVIGLVALFWMLFPAEAEADEKKVRPGGGRKESQAAGIRAFSSTRVRLLSVRRTGR